MVHKFNSLFTKAFREKKEKIKAVIDGIRPTSLNRCDPS